MVESEPKRALNVVEDMMGRSSAGSEVVVMDPRLLEAAARSAMPPVHNLCVTRSTRVHVGPRFVNITQNVDNTEVVKDLLLPGYLWDIAKSTTKAERLSCAAAMAVLAICITLILYFVVTGKKKEEDIDVAPHEWFITRDMWLAEKVDTEKTMDEYEPVRLVIIAHTAGNTCIKFKPCAAVVRSLQSWYMKDYGYDLPYNFLIGNEGRVYEGRGWNVVGAHTKHYNSCSIGIAFMGDYCEGIPSNSKVSEIQLKRAKMLLAQGVKLGHIHPQYQVVGARDLKATVSPGDNIYSAIQKWSQFANNNVFKNKTCPEIRSMFEEESSTTAAPQELKV